MLPLVAASMAPSVGEAPQPHPQQQQWRRRHGRWRGGASARGGTEMTGLLLGSLAFFWSGAPPVRGTSAFMLAPPPAAASLPPLLARHPTCCHHPTRPPPALCAARSMGERECGGRTGENDCGCSSSCSRRDSSRIGDGAAVGGQGRELPAAAASRKTTAGPAVQWRKLPSAMALLCASLLSPSLAGLGGLPSPVRAEDELATYAKEGNKVGVDAGCFVRKCSLPTHECLNNPDCLKGISCLSKCKGEGTCSTACFAKYGNGVLDDFLHCAVEEQDCVHVPRDRSRATWTDPAAVASNKMADPGFDIKSLEGRWYKVMGMDARYDCFDCQVNHFSPKPGRPDVMVADVQFRMPRPRAPGFWENHITEELLGDGPGARRSMHSVGRMFGLTFWENWYVIGESSDPPPTGVGTDTALAGSKGFGVPPANAAAVGREGSAGASQQVPPYKFIYYTGHTLQGNYEGAFVYARTPELPPELLPRIAEVARANGLDPAKFCKIRNTCFREATEMIAGALDADPAGVKLVTVPPPPPLSPAGIRTWAKARAAWLPQAVGELTARVNGELQDWFEDPIATSDWLIQQQERMVLMADDAAGAANPVAAAAAAAATAGGGQGGGAGASASTALAKKSP